MYARSNQRMDQRMYGQICLFVLRTRSKSRLWGDADRIRTLQEDVDSGEIIILEENDLVKYETDGAAAPPM